VGEAALKLKGNFGVAKELVFLIFLTPKTGTPELLRSPAPKTGTPELQQKTTTPNCVVVRANGLSPM